MHDFLIELQAKLDDLTSKENINSDIGKLQKKIDELDLPGIDFIEYHNDVIFQG